MNLFSRPVPEVWRRVGWVAAIFVVQAVFGDRLSLFGIQPGILKLAVFLFALRSGALPGVWLGFSVGFLLDLYGQGHLGCFSLSMCITTYLVGLLDEREIYTSMLTRILVLGGYCILQDFLWALSDHLGPNILPFLLHNALPSALYTMLLGTALFFLRPTRSLVSG
ncbi:MAG: rod shape-determining protein MreD [Fibrobacterota bacterium]|jgi:rod shape-determining protein MreD